MDKNRLHLWRLAGAFFFYVQGALCILWWLSMGLSSAVKGWFLWDGLSDQVLHAFFPGDILFYAGLSFGLGDGFSHQKSWIIQGSAILLGAAAYAFLMTLGLSIQTMSAVPGVILMMLSVAATGFFCCIADELGKAGDLS